VRLRLLERDMALPAAPSRQLLQREDHSRPAKWQPSPV
jgi:hypothetical protein